MKTLLVLITVLTPSFVASANAVDYTATLGPSDLFLNEFESSEDDSGGFDSFSRIVYGAFQPLFSADFSTLGQFTLRLEAPAGQVFLIDAPVEYVDSRSVTITIGTVDDQPLDSAPLTDLVFDNLVGDLPSFTGEFQDQDLGNGDFAFELSATVGGPFSFSALEATFVIPDGFDVIQINNPNVFAAIEGDLFGLDTAAPLPNPGLWIRIVPEPSSLALLSFGGALLYRSRR